MSGDKLEKTRTKRKFKVFLQTSDNRDSFEDCIITPCIIGTRLVQKDFSIYVIGASWIYRSVGICFLVGNEDSKAFKKLAQLKGKKDD